MGNTCSLVQQQSQHQSVMEQLINFTCQYQDYQHTDKYDNPIRKHLQSNFLLTPINASNSLMKQPQSKKFTISRQISAFQYDIPCSQQQQQQQSQLTPQELFQKQLKNNTEIPNKLPSVKICYGDFVAVSRKKIQDKYRIISKIGAGTFGQVYKAQHISSSQIRAIKIIRSHQIKKYWQQIEILKQCDHPNIVQIYQIFQYEHSLNVVMEYCPGGTIIQLIRQKKYQYLEEDAKTILEQVLHALVYLHKKGIVHGDLKLENIVFMEPSPGQSYTSNLKIIDFGCASKSKFKVDKVKYQGGTTIYMPPQSFSGLRTTAFDIWSCGVMLYILLSSHCPFKKKVKEQTIQAIKTKPIDFSESRWDFVSEQAKRLCKQMLCRDFIHRPSAQQCLKNSWFKPCMKRSQTRKASQRFTKNLAKYYSINNFVSVVQSYLTFLKMTCSQKSEIKRLFQAMDVRRQGKINKKQIIESYKKWSGQKNQQKMQQLISAIDKNKSGYIDYSQFVAVMSDRQKLFIDQSLSNAFDHFDSDGSGYIEKKQLLTCLKDCQGDINDLILQIDKDNDQRISKTEFIQYFKKIQLKLIQIDK